MFNKTTWKKGELLVCDYLKERHYKIVYTNLNLKIAELDIVAVLSKKVQKRLILIENCLKYKSLMQKHEKRLNKFTLKSRLKNLKDLLVIVEVKSRANGKFGSGLDAIGKSKKEHMKKGAEVLLKDKKFRKMELRFDVASVDAEKITYIENAF